MSYIDIAEHKNKIHCWERASDGELRYTVDDVPHYLFMRDNTGKGIYKDIYGNKMKKVEFDSKRKLDEFFSSRQDIVAEGDVRPVYRYIIDHFTKADTDAPYNVCLYDIEVDFDLQDGIGYPSPENPYGEINSFSIYDGMSDCYLMLIPSRLRNTVKLEDKRHGKHVEVIWTLNERDMLRKFSDYLEHVDITSAYNGDGFDWRYIMERASLIFGTEKAKVMFTRNNVPAAKREFVNAFGEDTWEWTFPGRPHMDMLKLFKKFHPGEKTSFKLDNVCQEELGEGKVDYEGDLGELYRTDPQLFYEYSLHDARLMMMLDEKKKVIDLAMLMVRDMCSRVSDIFGSVNIINMAFTKFCRLKDNIVLPNMPHMDKEDFVGAIVYDTISGLHTDVFTVDLTALYPSCIIMLGMSKENLLFQAKEQYEDYIKIQTQEDVDIELYDESTQQWEVVNAKEVYQLIIDEGWCISANGTIFDGSFGLLAEFTKEGFDQRAHYKGLMKETKDLELQIRYNLYQGVMKIRNNSIYGILSQPAFRMADIRVSASTTLTGQVISKYQAYTANKLINEQQ